jgi:hypothetical protein
MRLAQDAQSSAGALKGLGAELQITKGFAEEWLSYQDKSRSQAERRVQVITLIVSGVAAVAALIAAAPS